MSSLSMKVLELFDENRLSFDEAENILEALSARTIISYPIQQSIKRNRVSHSFIPPHQPSYMNGFTLEKHN